MISTLGGLFNLNHFDQSSRANDVIVIRHKDGSLHSTPFNVRFGRAQMWNYAGRVVQVEVNGELTAAVMKIGKGGETYWLQPTYGAFGGSTSQHHSSEGADTNPASTNTMENSNTAPAKTNTEAAAAALVGGSSNDTTTANTDGADSTSRNERSTAKASFATTAESPSLSVNAADLKPFAIHPESPVEVSFGGAQPARQPSQVESAAPFVEQNAPATTTASSEGGSQKPSSTTAAGQPSSTQDGSLGPQMNDLASSPVSPEAASPLPLLHRGDDGHLVVETRAIHSAEDVQEARLALQAMAAAEKSRRRLSKLLLTENAFFRQSAAEEGQLEAPTAIGAGDGDGEDGEDDEDGNEVKEAEQKESNASAQPWSGVDALVEASEGVNAQGSVPTNAAGAAAGAADGEDAQAPTAVSAPAAVSSEPHIAGLDVVDGELAAPVAPLTTSAIAAVTRGAAQASSSPVGRVGNRASAAVDAAEVSSAGSASGSTDSYKVEDADDYFLDPIDADDYAALYGAEELLKNVSFSSSVTSGVSITDNGLGGSGSDVSKPSPGPRQHAAVRDSVNYNGAAAASMPANLSTSDGHDNPLRVDKAVGKGGVASGAASGSTSAIAAGGGSGAPAGATGAKTPAGKREASQDDMPEMLDAEGRVVQPSSAAAAAAAAAGGPYFTRTLIPVEADLWKLHLTEGCNKVRYIARKDKGEVVSISCNIFLWNWTDRLVVSDVDGTITKSDLLGHVYAMLGKGGDWTHPGICNLYSKIERNGYHMVYLTARSVSQINQTKSYLFTLQQDGVGLPLGPVLTAPQRFFTALTQEVSKQSHVFKIACLSSVRAAFPPHTKPFFAGFGNRYNDVISYDAVSIPTHKIFIIDPSSVLHVCLVKQTYRDLGHLVDVTFPPLKRTPVLLRAPRQAKQPRDHEGKRGDIAQRSTGEAGKAAPRVGIERHAFARDLLHRSSSVSSSSISSSMSDTSSSCRLPEGREPGSATSENSLGDVSAASIFTSAQPLPATAEAPAESSASSAHVHHHHHHHHHTHSAAAEDGREAPLMRHASAAFSLADSFCVPSNSEGPPSATAATEGPHGASGRDRSSLPPRGPAPSFVTAAAAAASPTGVGRPTSQWASASTEYSGFSGPASPFMMKVTSGEREGGGRGTETPAAAASHPRPMPPAGEATIAQGSTRGGRDTTQPPALPAGAHQHTTAGLSNESVATNSGGAAAAMADTAAAKGPKYNYGQRGTYGALVVDEEEEEVPVDSDYSSFAYWRMDPRDLIAPSVRAAPAKPSTATTAVTTGAASSGKKVLQGATASEAGQPSAERADKDTVPQRDAQEQQQQQHQPTSQPSFGTAPSASSAASDLSSPETIKGRGLTSGNSSKDAVAAVKSAMVNAGGTVDAHKAGVEAANVSPTSASAYTDLATGRESDEASPKDKVATVSEESRAPPSPPSTGQSEKSAKHTAASQNTATQRSAERRTEALPLLSPECVAPPQKSGSTRRGFFAAFSFGRGQSSQALPESPTTTKTRQLQEAAKKKALAHPDAWEYYRAQEQHQEEEEQQQQQHKVAATGVNPLRKGPSSA